MNIVKFDPGDKRYVKQYLALPHRLYANTPQWVPPLELDARRALEPAHNPFFQHSQAAFFLALDEAGKALGRLAVLNNQRYNEHNHEKTGFFYHFECENDASLAACLFEAGFLWARAQGLDKITGPKGFSIFDGLGLLVRGFEHRPAFGLPYNPAYYQQLVESVGFEKESELVSGFLDASIQLPQKIHQLASLLIERRGFTISRYRSRADLRALVPQLKELYNQSLANTSGTVPITDQEADQMANQMLWFANPRLVKIVLKDGKPIGFLFAYPDISAALQRTKGRLFPFGWIDLLLELKRTRWINLNGAGMVEGYRGLGGTALLFSEMYKSVVEEGYQYADLVQIGTENDRMQRELRDLGINFYKTHRLYEKRLG